MPAPEAIFKPAVPGEAVATLVLIENSENMRPLWSDLRDHHLPTLLGTMRLANPIVPIQVLWLITSPVNDSDSPPSRDDKALPTIRFNPDPSNRISTAIIDRGINLLSSTFKNQVAARHLIVVAASSLSDPYVDAGGIGSKWQGLAEKMQKEQIYLHLILNRTQVSSPLSSLFYDVLKRQGHQEILPWFRGASDSTKYQFHLAGTTLSSISSANDIAVSAPYPQMSDLRDHPLLPRDCRYPLDSIGVSQDSSLVTAVTQENTATPSLVTQLQKMHGLTKKRIYGSQPVRQPFVRDTRRDECSLAPAPLPILPAPSSLSTTVDSPSAASRVPSKSKPDRLRRLSAKSPLNINTPESGRSAAPRDSWYRRDSRAGSSTDLGDGSYPSSPTSISSYSNSPVLPTPHEVDCLPAGAVKLVSAPWEPSWLRDQTEQYSSATTMPSHASSFNSVYDQGGIFYPYPVYPLQASSLPQSLAARDNCINTGVNTFVPRSGHGPKELPDDGDKPFILCPEYEAAATARFRAIFQAPGWKSNFTPMNPYADSGSVNHPSVYYASPSALPFTPADFSYMQDNQHAVPEPYTAQLGSTMTRGFPVPQTSGTSSLEGWNGQQ